MSLFQSTADFIERFGKHALLVGVYTNKSEVEMIKELEKLAKYNTDKTISDTSQKNLIRVYLEDVGSLKDPRALYSELTKIEQVLTAAESESFPLEIGLNILPNRLGSESLTAFNLAKKYPVKFIVNDMMAGIYLLQSKYADNAHEIMSLDVYRHNLAQRMVPNCPLFGGIKPPYSILVSRESDSELVKLVSTRSDALLVKTEDQESEVPLSRIHLYRECTDKAIILASKAAHTTVKKYSPHVDAFIVGSSLRKEGQLDDYAIRSFIDAVHH